MYAVLVIEMQKDIIYTELPIAVKLGRKVIPNIQKILEIARKNSYPIIYLCLQSLPSDPIIKKFNLPPHCIPGTEGIEVVDELKPRQEDYIVYIPRMDGFLYSNLEFILRTLNIKCVIITGVVTGVGCLLTALGAIQRGFDVILVSDACASQTEERQTLALEYFKKIFKFVRLVTVNEAVSILKNIKKVNY